jgi:hypothetical protein
MNEHDQDAADREAARVEAEERAQREAAEAREAAGRADAEAEEAHRREAEEAAAVAAEENARRDAEDAARAAEAEAEPAPTPEPVEHAPYRITGHVPVPGANGGTQGAYVVGHVYQLPVEHGDILVEQGRAERIAQGPSALTPEQEAQKAAEIAERQAEKDRAAEEARAAREARGSVEGDGSEPADADDGSDDDGEVE